MQPVNSDKETFDEIYSGRRQRRQSSLILFSILTLITATVLWAWFTKVDQVTRVSGEVSPSEKIRILQAAEQSVVKDIYVDDGDIVPANTILLELDPTDVKAKIQQLKEQKQSLLLRRARLEAEANMEESFRPLGFPASAELKIEELIFKERRAALDTRISDLNRKILQKENQLADLTAILQAIGVETNIIETELKELNQLVQKQLASIDTIFQLRKEMNSVLRSKLQTRSSIEGVLADIESLKFQKNAAQITYARTALEEMASIESDLAKIDTQIPVLTQRSQNLIIRAPLDSVVNKILIDGIGAVVQSGQELVELVPISSEPLVDAFVLPQFVSSIYLGQNVIIKFSSYDFSRYGGISGVVQRIGSNAVPHPETKQSMFELSVKTTSQLKGSDGKPVAIIPGMTVELDILGEKRRVADYFIGSLNKVKDRALRE